MDAVPAVNPTARIPTRGRSHPASGNPVHCSRAPGGAGTVFNHHRLAEPFGKLLTDDAANIIGPAAAPWERYDQS